MIILKKRQTISESVIYALAEGVEQITLLNVATYKVFYVGDIDFFLRNSTNETLYQSILGSEQIGYMLYVFF